MGNKIKNIEHKNFFDWKLNKTISKFNTLFIIILLIVYVALLVVSLSFIKKTEIDKIMIPEYEHDIYNEYIDTVVSYYANRTYSTSSAGRVTESLTYRFTFTHEGRSEVSTSDKEYRMSSFSAQVVRTDGVGTNDIKDVYYFTEQNSTQTGSSNNYPLVTDDGKTHPSVVYTRVQYYVGADVQVATNKEKLMIMPTNQDKNKIEKVFEEIVKPKNQEYDKSVDDNKSSILKQVSALNIRNKDNLRIGVFQTYLYRNNEDTGYNYEFYVSADDRVVPYHIDAQVWIEKEDGTYLPLCGAYNITYKYRYFGSSRYVLYDEANAKYICAKVVYYDAEGNSTVQYYKQEVSKLNFSFNTTNVGIDNTINN